ncbi:EAL domain-containing protein [Methylomonas sp. SURF-2]|uniref:EAL domain-containing protein n=1 Tax=Methylomonas subterranea TaxID=2952225 RepID=A0ABT1TLE6_9GAMM|nr:EAL domain-containing protein [Methylomonas sp. SURF-2]MCQ8106134.1 EAL domain-containing protein [Methylomonas sp. SURF-2]
MNSWFSRFTIKSKLFSITLVSSLFAMLFAFMILFATNVTEVKRKALEDFSAAANLIANRTIAAVMFDDPVLARENLSPLTKLPDFKSACVYGKQQQLFAELAGNFTPCPLTSDQLQTRVEQLTLQVYQPMLQDQEQIGAILIEADLSGALIRQLQFVGLVLVVLFIALVGSFLMTMPLLNRVAKPMTLLAKTAQKIGLNHDYSVRANKHSEDEIGILVDSFNSMLETIESKNNSLLALKNNFQALYDNNPTMVFDLGLNGQIQSVNQFGARQIGLGASQFIDMSIFSFTHPDDIAGSRLFFKDCLANPHKVQKQEVRLICQNGNIIWVRQTARLVDTAQNQQHVLLVCEDITETRRLADKIAYQASHDELTGLTNRRQFDEHIQALVEEAQADNSVHVMCYLDLDQFKVVNDTCGHLAGDELLRQLGELLRQQVRKTDVLARLGGDEFGILMAHCNIEQALLTSEKLRSSICDFQFAWDNRSFSISVSIGIAPIDRTSGNAVDILKEADAACYAAKEKGRNRIHVFSSTDEELAERQGEMQWVEKIRLGIEENRFQLYGQLIVPTSPIEEGLHFETLLRYRDEHGTIIPPGAFLPAAERYNIAPALDRWVISHLFEYLSTTPGFTERLELCSVNLSGLSLSDETMLDFISKQFRKWQIPTYKICFEITETAAISNLSYAKQFIDTLRKKGCLFSLDDFGSGLSSFAYLKNLPVDFLKIDGLFVKDILEDKIDWTMVKAINEVGHVMNKKTIAEFVENQNILELLKTLGVNYAQGYGIAKPVPLREL